MIRHRAWLIGAIAATAALAGMATTVRAQDWKLVETYPRVDGFLSDRQPEPSQFPNREIYDEGTAKFYSVFPLQLQEERVFIVDVYSYDFQPIIMVQDMNYQVIARGTIMDPIVQQNGIANHTRLELHNPWAGPAELLISSEVPDQGSFAVEWSLWKANTPAATTGSSEGGLETPCNCQDPATGRWFQSAFTDLGECYPERAVRWCN